MLHHILNHWALGKKGSFSLSLSLSVCLSPSIYTHTQTQTYNFNLSVNSEYNLEYYNNLNDSHSREHTKCLSKMFGVNHQYYNTSNQEHLVGLLPRWHSFYQEYQKKTKIWKFPLISSFASFPFSSNRKDLHACSSLYVFNLLKQCIFQEVYTIFPLIFPCRSKWSEP